MRRMDRQDLSVPPNDADAEAKVVGDFLHRQADRSRTARRAGLLHERALQAGRRGTIVVALAWGVPLLLSALISRATGASASPARPARVGSGTEHASYLHPGARGGARRISSGHMHSHGDLATIAGRIRSRADRAPPGAVWRPSSRRRRADARAERLASTRKAKGRCRSPSRFTTIGDDRAEFTDAVTAKLSFRARSLRSDGPPAADPRCRQHRRDLLMVRTARAAARGPHPLRRTPATRPRRRPTGSPRISEPGACGLPAIAHQLFGARRSG